jgi:serine/threonine protein kinase/tetratricopeptide (TPR) repeat protein
VTLAPGTRLASYEITALLGAGGMGEVYRARDSKLGRDVALKVLSLRLVGNREAVARFEQEARSASSLSHPHILHIYDIGTADVAQESVRYMVMEFVDGVTLSEKIRDRTNELRQLIDWIVQVAEGLAKAHAAGIVHRDLKPDNIMVSSDSYAKILDFGLAKLLEPVVSSPDAVTIAGVSPLSSPGMILGTANYMAPEQAQGLPTGPQADIFALGCILYEAAARRRAFEGSNAIDTLHKILHAEPDYSGVDPAVATIVRSCLAKRQADRYASVREVVNALRSLDSGATPTALGTRDSCVIAVLPFDDLSPTRDSEYFADGLAEEITSDLSKIKALRVLSRSSTREYRGDDKDVRRVATELGATYVIDGGVRKAGGQLRITAQLIDARTLEQLWSEKYSGTVDDVFDIQEKVARSVVERLQIQLTPRENDALAKRSMSNVAAWECYQRARVQLLRYDEPGLTAALREIQNGLAIAGPNVVLRAAEAYVYWQYYNAGVRPDPEYLDKAEAIGHEILASDPESPHGLRVLGLVAVQNQRVSDSVMYMQKVLAVMPNDADALFYLGFLSQCRKRVNGKEYVARLAEIDPLSPLTQILCGSTEDWSGRYAEALPYFERAHAVAEAIFGFLHVRGLVMLQRVDEAVAVANAIWTRGPQDVFAAMSVALSEVAAGRNDAMARVLTPESFAAVRADIQYPSWIAEIYAMSGDAELALDWLEHSITRGYTAWEYFTNHDRLLDALRDDPRFTALMDRARREWES